MSLFAPPQTIETEVFVRLPERYRRAGRCTWGDVNHGGADMDCFLEGPAFDSAGNLYVVDIPYGRIFRISPERDVSLVTEYDGEPNGLKVHPDGHLLVADYKNGIVTVDPGSGSVKPVIERRHTERFKGVNDLFLASNGDVYFTDQGQTGLQDPTGRVYRYTVAGRLELLLWTVPSPNGIVMNHAETTIFIAATRANSVWRAPMMADGFATKVGNFIALTGGTGPDGLAVDHAGNIAVAHAGMGSVWVFSPIGEPLYRVRSCTGLMTTNIAFGGDAGTDLYVTESATGTILRAPIPKRKAGDDEENHW